MSTIVENDIPIKTEAYVELEAKIATRTAAVGVIGLGYVGLPLGLTFSDAGFNVTGIDIDTKRIEAILDGRSYITDVDENDLQQAMRNKRFRVTGDLSEIRNLETVSICVPTPLRKTKDTDMSYVIAAAEAIDKQIRPGQLHMLRNATHPRISD